jgi:hypothetical protein
MRSSRMPDVPHPARQMSPSKIGQSQAKRTNVATLPTPTDWVLGLMAEGRKSALERLLPFEDLARQIAAQAVVAPPLVEDAFGSATN